MIATSIRLEYSLDGINWIKLGSVGNGTNWYDYAAKQTWNSDTKWHVSSIDVPVKDPQDPFPYCNEQRSDFTYEGIGIDDIRI